MTYKLMAAAVFLFAAQGVQAQVNDLRLFPATEETTEDAAVDDATAAEAPPVDPATERKQRSIALIGEARAIKVVRTASTLLSGMAERSRPADEFLARLEQHLAGAELAEGEEPLTPKDVADQVTRWYTAGDWADMQRFFGVLDADAATPLYDYLLQLSANDKAALLADEVLAAIDAAPVSPTDKQLKVLGTLLAKSGRYSGRPDGVLDALHAGESRHLGGDDPDARRRAARLLIDAQMPVDAVAFLPSLDDALAENDGEAVNLYASAFLVRATLEEDAELVRRGWDLSDTVLTTGKQKDAETAAMALAGAWSSMERSEAFAWQSDLIAKTPKRAFVWLGALQKTLEAQRNVRDTASREAWLGVIDAVADDFARRPEPVPGAVSALSLLTRAWLDEAYYTLGDVPLTTPNHSSKSPDGYAVVHATKILQARTKANVSKIDAETLLALQPHNAWRDLIDVETLARVDEVEAALAAHALDLSTTIDAITAADPVDARALTNRLLQRWIAKRDLNAGNTRYSWYWSRSYSDNVPLTRAKQRRNLDELESLVERLRASGAPRPSASLMAEAFAASHSPAEVYRRDDIERIFGAFGEIPTDLASALTSNLRLKLNGQWRSLDVQRDQETRRTDDDLALELERGYDMASRLLTIVADQHPDSSVIATNLGVLLFDYAEFMYGQEADLDTYAALRDRSFASFAAGSERSLRGDSPSASVPQFAWFQASLGASDLAQLTRQVDPDETQIRRIADALRTASEDHRDALFASFGERLSATAANVPPQLKPRYFRHGLEILGDHLSGTEARELLDYYDDLLTEVELAVLLDGSSDVGHGAPFGVHIVLRSTRELAREADSFRFLVRNAVYSRKSTRVNHRDDLAEQIRETFGEAFEVHAVTFHEENVKAMGFGRVGWQQTPLAYVALTARDPSVDRLPELQIDLDFADAKSSVLLPVASKVVLLDARSETPAPRPIKSLHALITLDDRNLAIEGHARLEVSVTSTGLIPSIEGLLATDVPGFTLASHEAHEMDVVEMGSGTELLAPVCSQSWTLLYEPIDGERVETFTFPVVAEGSGTWVSSTPDEEANDNAPDDTTPNAATAGPFGIVTYTNQRFADADIVDVEGNVVDITPVGSSRPWLLIIGLLILAGAAIAFLLWRRRDESDVDEEPRYEAPMSVTAFSSVTLLRRIAGDDELRLSDDEREALTTEIGDLEERYFANGASPDDASNDSELRRTVHRWLNVTRRA